MYRMFKNTKSLNLVANGTVMTVKDFLSFHDKGRITKQAVLTKFTQLLKEDEKSTFLVHLTLFLQLDFPDIREALELDDIYPFRAAKSNLSVEFYIELVCAYNLHKYFIYMIAGLHQKDFIKPIIAAVVPKLCVALRAEELSPDTVSMYILVFADLTRGEDEDDPFYFNLFNSLLSEFLEEEAAIVPRYHKISLLFRVVGVLCMTIDDYEGDSEIAELNKDFSFTLSRQIALRSMQPYQECFDVPENLEEPPIGLKALSIVSNIFSNAEYSVISEVEKKDWSSQNRFSFLNWLEFVGGCSYLALSLLKKYQTQLPENCHENLLRPAQFWALFKPKFTFQDFEGQIRTFKEFAELFTVFTRRRRYQQAWFLALLKYPEAFESSIGLKLLESVLVPYADSEVALALIQRIVEREMPNTSILAYEGIDERICDLVLNVLKNSEVKMKRNELLAKIFERGVHRIFMKKDFNVCLGAICVMMRTMNNERQESAQTMFEDTVFSIVLQNPGEALESLLTASLRSQYFKPLQWCKAFLTLPSGNWGRTGDRSNFPSTSTIGEVALFTLVNKLHELDPLLDFIGKGLPLLIAEGLMPFSTVEEIIRRLIQWTVEQDKHAKLVRVMSIYRKLITAQIELISLNKDQVESIEKCVNGIVGYTFLFSQPSYFGPILGVREKCLNLLNTIKKYKQETLKIEPDLIELSAEEVEEEMEEKSEGAFGFLYIRFPSMRVHIEQYFKGRASHPESSSGSAYAKCGIDLATHVNNSCRLEWDILIEYWRKVVFPNKPILQLRGMCKFVNGTVMLAFRDKSVRSANYLAFYGKFLNILEAAEDIDFKTMYEEQIRAVQVLVSFILKLYPPPPPDAEKKARGQTHVILQAKGHLFQLALLTILDLVEWITLNVKDYEVHVKERISKPLDAIPLAVQWPSGVGCLPIYSTIRERLNGGPKSLAPKKNYAPPSEAEIMEKLAALNLVDGEE